jgi:hypothetical protein
MVTMLIVADVAQSEFPRTIIKTGKIDEQDMMERQIFEEVTQ